MEPSCQYLGFDMLSTKTCSKLLGLASMNLHVTSPFPLPLPPMTDTLLWVTGNHLAVGSNRNHNNSNSRSSSSSSATVHASYSFNISISISNTNLLRAMGPLAPWLSTVPDVRNY